MRLLAPAKINLHLRVAPVDGSGFHPLVSWMCAVGLFDTLTIDPAPTGQVSLTCDLPTLACDASNLVLRAARAMQVEAKCESEGLKLHLSKRIPIGGGLGGGSSDAARVLLGLDRYWGLRWPIDRLSGIAATLGSDVPFFLHGASSLCEGRGHIVSPILRPRPRWVVLMLPDFAVSTPLVYRMFDQMRLGSRDAIETKPPVKQWADLSAGPLLSRLVNDLEAPAFAVCPQLGQLRADMEKSLGRTVRMSGSGSSLFTLFDEKSESDAAAAHIVQKHALRAIAVQLAADIFDDLTA